MLLTFILNFFFMLYNSCFLSSNFYFVYRVLMEKFDWMCFMIHNDIFFSFTRKFNVLQIIYASETVLVINDFNGFSNLMPNQISWWKSIKTYVRSYNVRVHTKLNHFLLEQEEKMNVNWIKRNNVIDFQEFKIPCFTFSLPTKKYKS